MLSQSCVLRNTRPSKITSVCQRRDPRDISVSWETKRSRIRATSERSSKRRAGKLNTKKRTVEKRWKEAESEQLQREEAKIGIEKSTKKVQKRRPNASAGRISHGNFQVSSRSEQQEQKAEEWSNYSNEKL